MSSLEILEWVLRRVFQGERVALITVIGKEGSAPRDVGTIMAVAIDGSRIGTLGGGELEDIIVKEAVSALSEGRHKRVKVSLGFESAPPDAISTKMICGGLVEVFINVIQPMPRLVLIGAGHVGKPIAEIGKMLGFSVLVIDKDPTLASPERYPYAEVVVGDVISEVEKLRLSKSDIVVIAYGEPETDYQVVKRLVLKKFEGNMWVLCSRHRAHWILDRLRQEGVSADDYVGKIHAPAGLDIGSDTPEEIAISIWAEIICELRRCRKPVESLGVFRRLSS